MTEEIIPHYDTCINCRHYRGTRYFAQPKPKPAILIHHCRAFTDGIPKEILIGENKHLEKYKGDNGIMFEKMGYL
jgi:hypothetical protein